MLSYDENFVPQVNPEDVNPNFKIKDYIPDTKLLVYDETKKMVVTKASQKQEAVESSNVNHPSHYNQGGVECIDGIAAACQGLDGEEAFCTGSAIKYLWRWKYKNGIEDLEKAKWYIDRLIKTLDKN